MAMASEDVQSPGKPRSIRGPLRYQITTSSPQLEAGTKFSIYTRITNPYDVAVIIRAVTTLLPVEFMDVALWERTRKKRQIVDLMKSVQGYAKENRLNTLFGRKSAPDAPQRMSSQALSSGPEAEADIVSDSDPYSIAELIRTSDDPEATKADALRQLRNALAKSEEISQTTTELQPGNSIIQVFTLKTNRSIFFPPNIYQSSVRVEYEIDLTRNIDVADYQLNIRAPLKAILFGALTGSLFGFLLRDLTHEGTLTKLLAVTRTPDAIITYLLALMTAMMIAGIAVVAFARKKDAQPILSVEDFWGGIFVGFLASYTGKPFLDTLGGNTSVKALPR